MMAVGIHMDSRVISAVRIDGSLRNPEITRFIAEPMPKQAPDNPHHVFEFRAKLLDDFLRRHKFPREFTFLAFDSEFCMHRLITVPFTADDQIRKMIRFQAEAHIHTANIDDVELTFKKLVQRESSSDVMVNIIRRTPLRETLRALKHEGVDPWGVDTPFAAGANAILYHEDAKLDEPVLWVDVGVASTMVALTHSGELLALRLPKVGLDVPGGDAEAVAHQAKVAGPLLPLAANGAAPRDTAAPRNVAYEAASQGELALPELLDAEPHASGDSETAMAQQQSAGALAVSASFVLERPEALVRRFVTELKRTLVSLATDTPPTKLRLSGGGEAAGLLTAAIREAFPEMEVAEIPAGFGLRVKDETQATVAAHNHGLLKPLGMALKGFGHNPLGFEFRRGEFAVQDAFEAVQAPLTVAVVLLVLLFGSLLLFVNRNQSRIDALETDIRVQAERAYRTAFDEEPPPTTREIYEALYNEFRPIERVARRGDEVPPVRSALEVWLRVQEAIEKVGREPTGEIRRVEGYETGIWPHRDPNNPHTWKPEHREMLELEWSIDSIRITENRIELRGRYVKVDGLTRLKTELEAMRDLLQPDPTGEHGRVIINYGHGVGDPNQRDSRGNPIDHRGTWTITADLQSPKIPRRNEAVSQ